MKDKLLKLIVATAVLMSSTTALALAVRQYLTLDDCPPLVNDKYRLAYLKTRWEEQQVIMVLRHATKCDDELPDCINGNEALTEIGKFEAIAIGEGLRSLLGGPYSVSHSYLDRTRDTALLAFGNSLANDELAKPCKHTFQHYLENRRFKTNRIFVTHSSCINSLKREDGKRLLGFNSGKEANFGIAAFLDHDEAGKTQVIGCVWPTQWAVLSTDNPVAEFLLGRR